LKKKAEEMLVKKVKNCERNMQELTNSIKRPNLRIMGIEGEEVRGKGICNIFNKIMIENFPNLEKVLPILIQKFSRTKTDLTKIEPPHGIILLKQQAQKIEKDY
jgi:hypothetical protein